MSEFRRLKMKIGDAEFEADVPEHRLQAMYDQFLAVLEQRNPVCLFANGAKQPRKISDINTPTDLSAGVPFGSSINVVPGDSFDDGLLSRIFDVSQDGAVTLKVLPKGPDKAADALLLLLYGYHRLKNEDYVLATQLFRAAEQSGISLRRPANAQVRNSRYLIRGGQRKGSNYALNSQGLAMAREITARIIGQRPAADISAS